MGEKNIFITALSIISKVKLIDYEYQKVINNIPVSNNAIYTGVFSGEPGIKCAIDEIANEGKLFDKFIILCSRDSAEKKVDISDVLLDKENNLYKSISAYEYTEEMIKKKIIDYCQNGAKKELVIAWLRERGYVINGMIEIDRYIHDSCRFNNKPLIINDNPNLNEIKNNIENSLMISDAENNNIYLDITGGTRIAIFVAMLISRWYEQQMGVNVKKVLYSSIMNADKAYIIDWSDNYSIFKITDSKSNLLDIGLFNEENVKLLNELCNHGKDIKIVDNYIKESGKNLIDSKIKVNVQYLEESLAILEDDNSLQANQIRNSINEALNKYKQKMLKNILDAKDISDEEYVEQFYGVVLHSLISKDIIKVSDDVKDKPNDMINTFNWYYSGAKQGEQEHCVKNNTKKMLKYLKNNLDKSPMGYWGKMKKVDNKYYVNYWHEPYYIMKGANTKMNQDFINKIKSGDIELFDKKLTDGIIDIISYEKTRNVFYNYGFPFACVSRANNVYDDIRNEYVEKTDELFTELENTYQNNKFEYKRVLDDVINEFEKYIPKCQIPINYLTVDSIWFGNDSEKMKSFMNELEILLEKARAIRNAKDHPEANKLALYRDQRLINQVAIEIRGWVDKYNVRHMLAEE